MEDVEKIIDKTHKRIRLVKYFECINLAIALAILVIELVVNPEEHFCKYALTVGLVTDIILLIVTFILMKHAREKLKHNCVRLKLVSQGYYDFCYCFISPDKLTFLQGPKTDDEKTMIIIIRRNGYIYSFYMRKEEIAAMFEPMFK